MAKATKPKKEPNQPPPATDTNLAVAEKPLEGAKPGQSFEDFTNQQLVKYNVTDAKIAELKAQYAGLVVSDEETYTKAKEAKRVLVPLRTGIEAIRKDLKAVALEYGRKIDGEAKRITEALGEIENPIQSQIEAWDEKAEIERQKVENAKIERAKKQVQTWVDFGVLHNVQTEQYYYFDHENRQILNLTLAEIKELTDAEIAFITENLEACQKIAQERKDEEDRIKKEEQDRLEQQRKDQEKKDEEQRKESERLAREKKEIEDALYETRSAKLIAAGMTSVSSDGINVLLMRIDNNIISVVRHDITGVDKATWAVTEEKVLGQIAALKQAEEDRLAEQKRKEEEAENLRLENQRKENERKDKERKAQEERDNLWKVRRAVLATAGFDFDGEKYYFGNNTQLYPEPILALSDPDFDAMIQAGKDELARHNKAEEDRKAQEAEDERKRLAELATDKQKIQTLIDQLKALQIPVVKAKAAKTVTAAATELKAKFILYLEEKVGGLK